MRALHTSLMGALLVAFLSAAMAQVAAPPSLTGWTGNWAYTGQMYLPIWDSTGACTLGTSLYNYAWFNYTFAADGVAKTTSFNDYQEVLVYWGGFNSANPCAGKGNYLYDDEDGLAVTYENYYYFPGGQPATFVVVSSSTTGDFSGIITQGWTNATSNSSGQTWVPIYVSTSSGDCMSESQSNLPYYQSLSVVVSSTGYYDVSAYFPRNAANNYPSYTYLALFKGAPNSSFTTNACGPVGDNVQLINAYYGGEQYAELVWQYLVAGMQYTLIVSTNDNTFWGTFGWNVQNSTTFNLTYPVTSTGTTMGGFTEPMRSSSNLGAACMVNSGSYNNVPYAIIPLNVPANQNFTIFFSQPHDYEFFYYTGSNPIPVACPATGSYFYYSDSGGPYDLLGGSASQYTFIATPYYTGVTTPGYQVRVYFVSGPAITSDGSVVTTMAPSTTGSVVSTSGSVSTGAVTTAKVTTGSTTGSTSSKATTSGNSTSGSSVSARVGGAVLFVAAVFALLL